MDLPSKNQVNQAGHRLRKRTDLETFSLSGQQDIADAEVVQAWRAAHADALTKTRIGLGGAVVTVLGVDRPRELVSQRLKTYRRIVEKLVRSKGRLAEMEDIAGCRAVLPDMEAVRAVQERVTNNTRKLEVETVRDYTKQPRSGGYRAVHLWCRRDSRKVEVQLRTDRQDRWARTVELWDDRLGTDLKHEDAAEPVIRYFMLVSEHLWRADCRMSVSETAELERAERDLRTYIGLES